LKEEKMKLELYVVDVVNDHKIKMDAMRLKIRKYGVNKEAWYHYAVGSIITLVAILIAFVVAFMVQHNSRAASHNPSPGDTGSRNPGA
jgi:hypothetical protein